MNYVPHTGDICQKCRPALIDIETRKVMPEDAPEMQRALKVWSEASSEERAAYHELCINNSREPDVMTIARRLADRMEDAMKTELAGR